MTARLIQTENGRKLEAFELDRSPITIGREPHCDIVVGHTRVSRRHVELREYEDTHTLQDLGSSNGTWVNGHRITQVVRLSPGDQIDLGNEAYFTYELAVERAPWLGRALSALILAASLTGGWWWWTHLPDQVLDEAAHYATQAVEAKRAGNKSEAKRLINGAYWQLSNHHRLDDFSRAEAPKGAMEMLSPRVGVPAADLLKIFVGDSGTGIGDGPVVTLPTPSKNVPCRLDSAPPSEVRSCVQQIVKYVMSELRQDPNEVPDVFYDQVMCRMRAEHRFIGPALERGTQYFDMMKHELAAAKMPPLLHYLAGAESYYKNTAESSAKAVGLWQFIPETGRRYGLQIGGGGDDRTDPVKSTRAAAQYLNDLAFEFGGGALLLAMAGYNRGEAGVRSSLRRMEDPFADRSYWRLSERRLLPEETRMYVSRIMAMAVAGEGGLPAVEKLPRLDCRCLERGQDC
jgi:hypothetical protein